ncbi:UDP-2,3-diacylglucosamine diphosphatase [Gracilimonas mengyeensis]|uniref:UDP-2,3-diacylglucosamine pyrophosphatase LpxH n=1 Tax=Gracilimonas mengyeensis TaxID=1302730 RepID=A0A521DU59_9BACT|nr:metallophosphoesterase [Gracilimonas mengyeensis]SMO74651.1 UDP-2,3-diacylglucosamine pyrophosphatase LpxH [Gracilimonas mengyeensis]
MNPEQHVFLSDVHLGAFSQATNQHIEDDLIALIHHCARHKIALYVLGDLFDYWMEYPDQNYVPSLGKNVLDAFEEYNKSVAPALYVTGNHDNWTFGHFKDRGFDVEPNFRLLELEDKRMLLMHGDGVASSRIDFPRAGFHKLLRSRYFVDVYQKVFPPQTGVKLMKWFSSMTRKRNYINPKPLNRQAEKMFNRHQLDYILSGHDHIPRKETFGSGEYINLGTFFNHRSLALYNNSGMQLVRWEAGSQKFTTFTGN